MSSAMGNQAPETLLRTKIVEAALEVQRHFLETTIFGLFFFAHNHQRRMLVADDLFLTVFDYFSRQTFNRYS